MDRSLLDTYETKVDRCELVQTKWMIPVKDILQQELQDPRYLLIEWNDQGVLMRLTVSFTSVENRTIFVEQIRPELTIVVDVVERTCKLQDLRSP